MNKLYFAYGANTNLASMQRRCPTARYVCNLTLHHHQLVFKRVADVVMKRGAKVEGALWVITPEDEKSLDRFEGFPNTYVKKYVTVMIEGRKHRVMFYVIRPYRRQELPSVTYESTLRTGYADCGLPEKQIDRAIERAERWIVANPAPAPKRQDTVARPYIAAGRYETEDEQEARLEQQADLFFQSLYCRQGRPS